MAKVRLPFQSDLDMQTRKVERLADGSLQTDAVNKKQLDTKVDKVADHGLSQNDLTDTLLAELQAKEEQIRGILAAAKVSGTEDELVSLHVYTGKIGEDPIAKGQGFNVEGKYGIRIRENLVSPDHDDDLSQGLFVDGSGMIQVVTALPETSVEDPLAAGHMVYLIADYTPDGETEEITLGFYLYGDSGWVKLSIGSGDDMGSDITVTTTSITDNASGTVYSATTGRTNFTAAIAANTGWSVPKSHFATITIDGVSSLYYNATGSAINFTGHPSGYDLAAIKTTLDNSTATFLISGGGGGGSINAQATYAQAGVTLEEVSAENRLTFGDSEAVADFVENIGWPLGNQNFEFASGQSFNFEIVEADGTTYSFSAGRLGGTTNFIYDTTDTSLDHISFQTASLNVTTTRTGTIRTNLAEAPVTDIVGGTNVTLSVADGTLTINSTGGTSTGGGLQVISAFSEITSPTNGQDVYLDTTDGTNQPGIYQYNSTDSEWVLVIGGAGVPFGNTLPRVAGTLGELFRLIQADGGYQLGFYVRIANTGAITDWRQLGEERGNGAFPTTNLYDGRTFYLEQHDTSGTNDDTPGWYVYRTAKAASGTAGQAGYQSATVADWYVSGESIEATRIYPEVGDDFATATEASAPHAEQFEVTAGIWSFYDTPYLYNGLAHDIDTTNDLWNGTPVIQGTTTLRSGWILLDDFSIITSTTFPTSPTLGDEFFLDVSVSHTDGTNQRPRGLYTYVQPSSDPDSRFWEQLHPSNVGQLYNNARENDIIYLLDDEDDFNTTGNNFTLGFYRADGNVGDDNHTTWASVGGSGSSVRVNTTAVSDPNFTQGTPTEGDHYSPTFVQNGNNVSVDIDTSVIGQDLGIPAIKAELNSIAEELSNVDEYTWIDQNDIELAFVYLAGPPQFGKRSNEFGDHTNTAITILDPKFDPNTNNFTTYARLTDVEFALFDNNVPQNAIIGFGPDADSLIPFQLHSYAANGHGTVVEGEATYQFELRLIQPDTSYNGAGAITNATHKTQFESWRTAEQDGIFYYQYDNANINIVRHSVGSHISGSTLNAEERAVIDALEGIAVAGNATEFVQVGATGALTSDFASQQTLWNGTGAPHTHFDGNVDVNNVRAGDFYIDTAQTHFYRKLNDLAADSSANWSSGSSVTATTVPALDGTSFVADASVLTISAPAEHSVILQASPNTDSDYYVDVEDVRFNEKNVTNVSSITGDADTFLSISGVSTFNGAPANALEKVGLFLGTQSDAETTMVNVGTPAVATEVTYTGFTTSGVTRYFHAGIALGTAEQTYVAGSGVWANEPITQTPSLTLMAINLIG